MARRSLDRLFAGLALVALFAGAAACACRAFFPSARQQSLDRIRGELFRQQADALTLAELHLESYPDDPPGLALAAQAACDQSKHELAIRYFKRLPVDGGRWEFFAQLGHAGRLEILGDITGAELHLRRALELSPYDTEAHSRIGRLLQAQGRTWESAPHFFLLIRRGKCRPEELLGMAAVERFFHDDARPDQLDRQRDPREPLIKLADARLGLLDNRTDEAERLLREVVSARPDLGEAQGRLGRMIVDRGDVSEFLRWRRNLPDEARDHPEVWFAQGLQAHHLGQTEGAITCFLKVLALAPNHLGANRQIAGCLGRCGRTDAAGEFARRAELLAELESALHRARVEMSEPLLANVVRLAGQLGRNWEAAGWAQVMTLLKIPQEKPRRELRHWLALARREASPEAHNSLPWRHLDRRDFTAPRWPDPSAPPPRRELEAIAKQPWRFVDDAVRLGLRFQYFEGTTEENRLQHVFNVFGGGLAALDYDLDGWPDLYLPQAKNWRDPAPQPQHTDKLFRNLGGERFVDVTAAAQVADPEFSHGVTVGDFDQDGLPDVYVGNLGPNRLFHNNGDGTFADVTGAAGVAGNEWTTSSVFSDFSGDGLPDLYVLNYSTLEHTRNKECTRRSGERIACVPSELIAEPDRCYLNLGDGTFRDVSSESGIRLPEGKGLGVVVWDFAGDGRLGIYVANDASPSFLFLNDGPDVQGIPRFREQGIVRGVALDADGNPQACMGVAAGDPSGDGRIDLFITTFFGESKTFYSQREDEFFDDVTRDFNLREPGLSMLGFGCQFVDLDGDGWEDLIITNGHVDQRSSRGDPDRMRPQVFHNLSGRSFTEVPASALGAFFQGTYLGRGLATLDWNRDGRTDVAISHLHAPFALLTNQTPPASQPLVVKLIGRSGCREPTGAVIRMRSGATHQVRLQTAGDGFLVTNERRHQFAVPGEESTADLEVRWPGGLVELWRGVPAGVEVLLVEGRAEPVVLHRFAAVHEIQPPPIGRLN
jgi:tetratricopeptide (TPR) repeat protein